MGLELRSPSRAGRPSIVGCGPPRWAIVGLFIFSVSFFLIFSLGTTHTRLPQWPSGVRRPWRASKDEVPSTVSAISNETLGFEKIYVVNLPERSDKRDAMSLAAALTNISLSWEDGVKGADIVNKSLPKGAEDRPFPETQLGSWRAHMNAIRRIVEERRSSALIMEDDLDWDIRLKPQLLDFARGTRFLLHNEPEQDTHSPYGDGWDLLWLGHCHDDLSEKDPRTYVIRDDPSVPQVHQLQLNNPQLLARWPDHTRVVHRTGGPICTFAYALSLRGAEKVLYHLSVHGLNGLFDNALSWWCTGDNNPTCLDAHPSYFMQHRVAGARGKNSDNTDSIGAYSQDETLNIRWSTHINIEKLMNDDVDYIDSYPDIPKPDP